MTANYYLVALLICVGLMSCQQDVQLPDEQNILGRWISTDQSDTLLFDNINNSMYHSCATAHTAPFTYQLVGDSIRLTYKGTNAVTVKQTTHLYYMNENFLSIDFNKPSSYGFSKRVINYLRSNQ